MLKVIKNIQYLYKEFLFNIESIEATKIEYLFNFNLTEQLFLSKYRYLKL